MPNIALDRLNASHKAEFVAELGDIYEHAPWVAEAVCDLRPFATLAALHEAMTAAVTKAPRRSAACADQGAPRSGRQGGAGRRADRGLHRRAGERRPQPVVGAGIFRFSPAQRGLPDEVRHPVHRLRPPPQQGFDPAAVQAAPEQRSASRGSRGAAGNLPHHRAAPRPARRPRPTGSRCTAGFPPTFSILAAESPARGVKVELLELSDSGARRTVATAQTNPDGRTDAPLIGGQPVPIGRYELQFHIADYFAGIAAAAGRSAVSRRGADPVLGRGRRRPLSRAAAGDALELLDLSRKLTAAPDTGIGKGRQNCLVLRQHERECRVAGKRQG